MGEGGGTAHFRVQSIVRVNRHRLPSKAFLKRLGCNLRGSSHLDSTRTLVPRPLIR
ncbi:hypothetical protein RchiOBHm_MTg0499261 (mitochondrion) [Rosa chinensis]|uniref:Uncharacterized protein n=1 Tax=Rosa chinensis TaxID=74649 RepID=A0A2P6P168_ROSCH|nr:hypothetical protein RchiOBHm_MTg0499261 [Rosa chinensis]